MPVDYTYVPFIKSSRKRHKKPSRKRSFPDYAYVKHVKDGSKPYHLGKILLGSTNNVLPDNWNMCKCFFKTFDEKDVVTLQFDDDETVIIDILNDFSFIKDVFNFKVFEVNFETVANQLFLDLYFSQLPLPKFNPRFGKMIKICFSLLYNIPQTDSDQVESNKKKLFSAQEINELFKEINDIRTLENLELIHVKTTCLNPRLRPYQENAVKWMIHRENEENSEVEMLHLLYEEIKLDSGIDIYYNKYDGYVDVVKPVVHNTKTGGILADEMGLGKTVEVLACILSNRKNNEEDMFDVNIPVNIETQPRKVTPKSHSDDSELFILEGNKPKKLKLSPEFVKGSSKKLTTYMALEKWYENKLQEVSKKKETMEETVFCICGNNSVKNTVQCVVCLKYQHRMCLGYKKRYGKYRCPQCWVEQPLIKCGATLIVCPASLKKQWCSEISKHVKGGLKVLLYEGASVMPVYPTRIKHFDIVLTTYNVLTAEFRLLGTEQSCVRRRHPKYAVFNSPLLRVKWWRLCLDEAQTVDVPGSMVSEMAGKLNAVHRWAVTGTPISKNISDLFGLIRYLHFEPYCDIDIWTHKLYYPYLFGDKKPMVDFLVKIFWRSTKAEVIDQINIPQQSTEMHWLELSAVEKYFYTREHELCCFDMLKQLQSFTDLNLPLKMLDKSLFKKLLSPLLSLRQTCTHPNVVRGRYLATRKQVNSMEDLLEALITKNKNDSEECLRVIVSTLNGLAGIYLLLQKPDEAIENYRKVLQLNARFNKGDSIIKLTIDKLQLIHTMYNLSEILEINPTTEHTLRDSSLKEECALLEQQYIEKSISNTFTVLQETANFSAQINQLQTEFILPPAQWYVDLINWIMMYNLFDEFRNRLKTIEDTNETKLVDFVNHDHFKNVIGMWDEEINACRTFTINAINNLYIRSDNDDFKITIPQSTVQEAIDCHLQPQKRNKKKTCSMCIANKYLVEYESKIFLSTMRIDDEKAISNLGSWKSSKEELMLKALLQLGKVKNADQTIIKDGQLHLNIINLIKKEFKTVRKLWTYLDEYVCKMSEVNTSKIRLRLKTKNVEEKRNKVSNILKQLTNVQENRIQAIHMLEEHELDYQRSVLISEEQMNMIKLERYLGTSKYLETLRTQQKEGNNTDPCPICKSALVDHWSVLMCGHSYCMDCIQKLLEQTHGSKITCSICRQKQNVQDITYLHTSPNSVKGSDVKGNYSSKIAAITQLLIELTKEDETIKVLIFSQWLSVLKVIRLALEENEIKSAIVTTCVDKSVNIFKTDKSITALLLPIFVGSKGLNLIEATHVILVEPLLNPGEELQAIGRIHRIGQTKPTVVHKFLVKNTIEESIHQATTLNMDNWDDNKVTLLQLKNLFVNTSVDEVTNVEEVNVANVEELSEANVEEVNEANVEEANLANLEEVNVANVEEFNETNVEEVNEANMEEVNEANVEEANLANLEEVNVANVEELNETNVEEVNEANVEEVNEANVEEVNLANLEKVNVANVEELNESNVEEVNEANVEEVNEANVEEANLANLEEVNVANVEEVNVANVKALNEANVEEVNSDNIQ